MKKIDEWKAVVYGFACSTLFTMVLAILLKIIGIPITVILPTSAPIWIGIATMVFMVLKE